MGWTSLELYFSSKFNIPLNNKSLCMFNEALNMQINSSLQHITYNQIVKYSKLFNINFDNIKIITIVRNPYERIMSDLFFFKLITIDATKETVFNKWIFSVWKLWQPQYTQHKFITNEEGEIIQNIYILKTESLINDMYNLSYSDFNIF